MGEEAKWFFEKCIKNTRARQWCRPDGNWNCLEERGREGEEQEENECNPFDKETNIKNY